MDSVKVGIVGCGNISNTYLRIGPEWEAIDIVACADLVAERAVDRAREYGLSRACGVEELIADDDIDIVLNLTIPHAHFDVARAALAAGKAAYNEKPLCIARAEGRALLDLASERGLRLGGAPDTFLGAGLQTCRKLIDDGVIGEPVAATAFMMGRGHERWHPDPEFFYKSGGGPMFDMGPYYLTALIALLGPVKRVTGTTATTFAERTVGSEPKRGEIIAVEVPTHVAGIMEFANGAVGTITTSFDVWGGMELPRIGVYGTEGSLSVPNPNGFGGPVHVRERDGEWREMALTHAHEEQSRSIGVADLACALRSGRPHRASGELAFHVLDIMHAFHDASERGAHVDLGSTCERPAALPAGLPQWQLDP